ncbi:MAG TPA: ergothioneine biosynthesis protein EgtB [Burkholderiaceae bacterium]|nr:ergothioneine biosynthesis protein EgtB [Burkholderiaceae bacterium]
MTAAPDWSVRRFLELRAATCALADPLSEADAQAQSMPDASPVKWHLAHTTWFFETFVLEPHEPGFRPHHPAYRVLFNSYYNGIGEQHARAQRGLVTRPGLAEVLAYRRAVDERVASLLARDPPGPALEMLTLGLHHEQQHQELILTDVLHLLSCNPLRPAYRAPSPTPRRSAPPLEWIEFDGGRVEIGHDGHGFAFDNEQPRHPRLLAPHALANRLVTQGEWLAFIDDGGYADPRWWLSAGWDWVRAQRVEAPLYWQRDAAQGWQRFTLAGLTALDIDAPVLHVSLYEADAYARWTAAHSNTPCRLPTEAEWESAAAALAPAALQEGNLAEDGLLRALPARAGPGLRQMFGDAWEWTRSAYEPYPGYRPWAGAAGEYNGKFMIDQQVLRGGSFATPRSHIRASYRNFFPAAARWQFSGLRLARDLA